MIIQVSELPPDGLSIRDVGALGAPFADPTWRLREIDLHVRREGVEVVVEGVIGASVPQVCGRCLEPFRVEVRAPVASRFEPRPGTGDHVELSQDDLETDFYANDQLDLAALVETETSLALPMRPLCRDDCRGLCPVCGGNRNVTPCACHERTPDPRLAALGDLKARLQR
jgi:uncharacterized protein